MVEAAGVEPASDNKKPPGERIVLLPAFCHPLTVY